MKKIVFKVVFGLLAAGAAGAGGYYLWRRKKAQKASERAENEALDVTYISYQPKEKETAVRDDDDRKVTPMDARKAQIAKAVHTYLAEEEKDNFETYLSSMEYPEDEEDEEEGDEAETDIPAEKEGPYPISAGEFCNTRSYYDKVSVNYFEDDDVVADDRDEVLENAPKILGDLQNVFDAAHGKNIVYIRNEELEIDYEINLVNGSYRKEVLHMKEE